MHNFQVNEKLLPINNEKIDKKLLPMKIHFFLSVGGAAPIFPFLTTISMQRGYSSVIVGLMFTLFTIPALLIRPVIGTITDKYKCRKTALILTIAMNCLALCALMFIPGTHVEKEIDDNDVIKSPLFWLFFSTIAIWHTSGNAEFVLENTICVALLGENIHKFGKQRVWGAVGWGTTSFLCGAVVDWFSRGQDYKNYTPGMIIALVMNILDLYVASKFEDVQNRDKETDTGDMKQVLTNIRVLSFIFWVVVFGFLNAFVWHYLFWYMEDLSRMYHPETISYIKTLEGLTQTIQCFGGEVPFFFLSSYILKRVDGMKVFSLMFFGFAVRFFLYSIIKNPVWVLPVEFLNGLTYALAYAAATSYSAEITPVGAEGTLQGIVATALLGIGAPIGSFVGGFMFDRFSSITSFGILSGIAFAICIIHIIENQFINRYCKDKKFKANSSHIVDHNAVGDVNDNL
ncbi:major facilitator superfamily domain-containing protein 6-A-like isoform X2 [Aphis gossypii]|uniref:major facilitator superfamily domain-containing protein 6-A-like isoform X2 n=1 Tax=Aphis gossypii TaxID=80765 RepID=UPI002159324A|nr:major facilitator superfamily domain-containing protein 6-A-like isoform X2 [Aphis gossypii]